MREKNPGQLAGSNFVNPLLSRRLEFSKSVTHFHKPSSDSLTDRECHMADDDQLMIRVQSGDATAFEALVERYQGPLLGFFVRNTRDRYLAEDLTQETLLKVYDQSWNYLPRGRFRGWMYRIARNLMIDDIRRRSHDALIRAVKGHKVDEDDALARLAGAFLSPDECASAHELSELVDNALEALPDEQRLTFTLFHYAGLSLIEVAEIMKTKLPTCKSRLRLAREKLVDHLHQKGVHARVGESGTGGHLTGSS